MHLCPLRIFSLLHAHAHVAKHTLNNCPVLVHSSRRGVLPEERTGTLWSEWYVPVKITFSVASTNYNKFFQTQASYSLYLLCLVLAPFFEFSADVTYNQFYDLFHAEMSF